MIINSQSEPPASSIKNVTSPADRFMFWPTMVVIASLAVLGMMSISVSMMVLGMLIAIIPLSCTGLALVQLYQSVLNKRWRRAASLMIMPLFVAALVIAPFRFVYATNYVRDLIVFAFMVGQFDEELNKLPDDGKRYHQFDWSGFAGVNISLTYDETDTLPTTLRECRSVDHFIGHYYYCVW
jgi:uncharacterized RDD family membrane protein YckC